MLGRGLGFSAKNLSANFAASAASHSVLSMRRFTRLTNGFSKKGSKPTAGARALFHALQLLPEAFDNQDDARDQGGADGSPLDAA